MEVKVECGGECRCLECMTARNADYHLLVATQLATIRATYTAAERETAAVYQHLMYG